MIALMIDLLGLTIIPRCPQLVEDRAEEAGRELGNKKWEVNMCKKEKEEKEGQPTKQAAIRQEPGGSHFLSHRRGSDHIFVSTEKKF